MIITDTNTDFLNGTFAGADMSGDRINVNESRPWVENGRTYIAVNTGGDPKDPGNYKAVPVMNRGTLRRDEWELMDAEVLAVQKAQITGFDDLIRRGLVKNLANGMAQTVFTYHDVSDAFEAVVTMDGVSRSQNDRVTYNPSSIPLPITHVDFQINARELAESRRNGNGLDVDDVYEATYAVRSKINDMLFTDVTYSWGNGGTIYSFVNHPNVNDVTLTAAWTASAADPIADVLAMKQALIDAYFRGPYILYVPTAYSTVLDEDYVSTTSTTITIRQRILAIDGISDIMVEDSLPANKVVMVQATPNVIRIINGSPIQVVQWQVEGMFINKFKVFGIQVPQIRKDANGRCGVALGGL